MSVRIKCQNCAVRAAALCSAVSEEAAAELGRSFHRRRVPAGQIIYGGEQQAKSFAIIVSGIVKLVNAKPDGRQQIVGLQFPADFLGHPQANHTTILAEAATDLDLCCFSGSHFENLMRDYPEIERILLQRTLDDLDLARDWMFMLGRKTARERVASLLLLIAERMLNPVDGGKKPCESVQSGTFDLPLSRSEMAECLGLRLETVSRQMANLNAARVISASRTRVLCVHDMAELRRMSESPGD